MKYLFKSVFWAFCQFSKLVVWAVVQIALIAWNLNSKKNQSLKDFFKQLEVSDVFFVQVVAIFLTIVCSILAFGGLLPVERALEVKVLFFAFLIVSLITTAIPHEAWE